MRALEACRFKKYLKHLFYHLSTEEIYSETHQQVCQECDVCNEQEATSHIIIVGSVSSLVVVPGNVEQLCRNSESTRYMFMGSLIVK